MVYKLLRMMSKDKKLASSSIVSLEVKYSKPHWEIVLGEGKTLDTDREILFGLILLQLVENHPQVVGGFYAVSKYLFLNFEVLQINPSHKSKLQKYWGKSHCTKDTEVGMFLGWFSGSGQFRRKGFGCSLKQMTKQTVYMSQQLYNFSQR